MFFVVRPGHPWWTATPHNLAVFGTYLLGALTIVVISSAMHLARQRAIDRQIELEREAGVRVQAEEALRKAHDELELRVQERTAELARSNAELQQFAYVASHDLQEPLRMVSNFTQLLAERYDSKLDSDGREFIAYAVEGATRMQTLVQDLLLLSRVGTQGSDELPEVMADSSQMMQLFQNLIGNGIKFKGAEPPRVHISASRKGKEWTFSVRDNGTGFEPQYAVRIFAVFQRLHSRDQYQGNGIGLHASAPHTPVVVLSGAVDEQFAVEAVQASRGITLVKTYANRHVLTRSLRFAIERKRGEDALRAARVLTMGELAASIAHEVNQPLAAVVTNAEAALRWLAGVTPNLLEAHAALVRISQDGNRASQVIRRIRAFLKKGEGQAAPLDINEAIQDAVTIARGDLVKSRVALRLDLSTQLPPVVGDRIQLQQVVLNLVMNQTGCGTA